MTGYFQAGGATINGSETVTGNHQVNGNQNTNGSITSSGIMRSYSARVIAQGGSGSNPSLCAYNTVGYASCFFCDNSGNIGIGDADGNGVPQNYRFSIDRSSNASTNGGALTAGYLHTTGSLQVDGGSQINGSEQVNGNAGVSGTMTAGTVSSNGNTFAHSAYYCDNAAGGFFHRDGGGTMGMQIYCNTSNNIGTWVNNRTGAALTLDPSDTMTCNVSVTYKPGGGAWQSNSDARVKNVTGDFVLGLDEVLQLRPVVYTYKGNDTPTRGGQCQRAGDRTGGGDPARSGAGKRVLSAPYLAFDALPRRP